MGGCKLIKREILWNKSEETHFSPSMELKETKLLVLLSIGPSIQTHSLTYHISLLFKS